MGLDGVEIVLEIEETFEISIPDDEAGDIITVGDLHNLILEKLDGRESKRCLTSAAFYHVRRGLVNALGLARRDVRPSTRLAEIFPEKDRRERWERMRRAIYLRVPELAPPGWIRTGFLAGGAIAGITPVLTGNVKPRLLSIGMLGLLGSAFGFSVLLISPRLATAFPDRAETAGDLARQVLAANHRALAAKARGWNRAEVWEIVCGIIVRKVGVAREEITPSARIVDDLRID